jgi:hypothetical protein
VRPSDRVALCLPSSSSSFRAFSRLNGQANLASDNSILCLLPLLGVSDGVGNMASSDSNASRQPWRGLLSFAKIVTLLLPPWEGSRSSITSRTHFRLPTSIKMAWRSAAEWLRTGTFYSKNPCPQGRWYERSTTDFVWCSHTN